MQMSHNNILTLDLVFKSPLSLWSEGFPCAAFVARIISDKAAAMSLAPFNNKTCEDNLLSHYIYKKPSEELCLVSPVPTGSRQ